MSATNATNPAVELGGEAVPGSLQPTGLDRTTRFLAWLDEVSERIGDRINPILVKETRQALKSRQFVVTFSLLLLAALGWTIAGSLSLMPQIYTTPSAQRLLIGYYVVLAVPMLLVVPMAAYRSLEVEIDDGTLELLSITTLSPKQIVLGKLASAALQMLLYFIALFPCVAYAYTLRGVDLPTVVMLMSCVLVVALLLTTIGLFFAPLAMSRSGRIMTLLAVLLILLAAEYAMGWFAISLILYGISLTSQEMVFWLGGTLLMSLAVGHLLLTAAAAQLTPESENRSTGLRVACSLVSITLLGWVSLAIRWQVNDAEELFGFSAAALLMLWTLAGSMMAAESTAMTPRIRRELPSSFLARLVLTWLTPGPATGIVFAAINIIVLGLACNVLLDTAIPPNMRIHGQAWLATVREFTSLACAYLIGYLILVRCVVAVLRINNHPRVEIGIAAMVAVLVLGAIVPYSVGMHMNDYRPYPYSVWQITNWVWTANQSLDGTLPNYMAYLLVGFVGIGLLGCVLAAGRRVLPGRIATPEKVKQELAHH